MVQLQLATFFFFTILIFPYKCMSKMSVNNEQSRIANTRPSTADYNWMVLIGLSVRKMTGAFNTGGCVLKFESEVKEGYCTGSIISAKKHILTAAHCICIYRDNDVSEGKLTRYCLPNKVKTRYTNQQTGEKEHELNYLEIFVGDKDRTKAKLANVRKAYVMKTHGKKGKVKLKDDFDIGLIISDSRLIKSLPHLNLPKPGQIFDDKVVKLAGWGLAYEEIKTKNGIVYSTSCMTTNQGPIIDHFKPCDPKYTLSYKSKTGHACRKGRPPAYKPTLKKCKDYWKLAPQKLDAEQKKEFTNVDIIQVKTSKTFTTCYRKTYFDDPGWCKIKGGSPSSWGICSESCQYVGDVMRANFPKIYHETDKVLRSRKHCRTRITAPDFEFLSTAETCIESVYPENSIWKFKYVSPKKLIFMKKELINIKKEYIFTGLCHGDSGAPLWVQDVNIIVAIYSSSQGDGACGAETTNPSEFVFRLTKSKINRWIKGSK